MVIQMFEMTSCMICGNSIKDPICRVCYVKQTKILLNDLKIHSIPKDYINDKLKKILNLESLGNIKCILCKKDIVNICHHCFLESLITILREINFSEDLIENFEYVPMYEEFYDK